MYSYEREFAPHVAFAKQFLPELSRTSTEPVDFIEVSLQPVRVSRSAPDDSMMGYVRAMLAGRQPDLVVPIGGPATAFAQRNRQQLFPGAPMLLAGVDQRFVQNGAMSPNDTAVTVDHEPKRVVENILRVLPDTKTVFVVVGASHLEEVWLHEMKGAFRQFEGQLTFSWANELSFADMLTRCANLPPAFCNFLRDPVARRGGRAARRGTGARRTARGCQRADALACAARSWVWRSSADRCCPWRT